MAGLLSVWYGFPAAERHLGGGALCQSLGFAVWHSLALFLRRYPGGDVLHKHGAGKGATVSFLLSTPQTGVDSILVTYSLMGPALAVFRPLAALATGLFGGGLVDLAEKNHNPPGKDQHGNPCTDDCCSNDKPKTNWFVRAMRHGFVTLPSDIGRSMLIGLVVAAFITAVVPDDFSLLAGGGGLIAMLTMLVTGIPVYVCHRIGSSCRALMAKGSSPAAAMVFDDRSGHKRRHYGYVVGDTGQRSAIAYLVSIVVWRWFRHIIDSFIFAGP